LHFKHRFISLEDIDFDDEAFCLAYPCRAQNLLDSIDLVGIIHPPVLRKKKDQYQIICGRGRLKAAKRLGIPQTLCKILPSWINDLTCLTISFEENRNTRGFNIIEQALVVEKFLHFLTEEEVIKKILPRLGYSKAYKNLQFLLALNFLEEEAKKLLLEDIITPHLALQLLGLEAQDRHQIISLFGMLRPGSNRQRQILEILKDLAQREDKSITEILRQPAIKEIITDQRLSAPQKTEKLYLLLKKWWQPLLTRREEEFKKLTQRLSIPGMRLSPSPSFERDSILLQIEFKDLKDLKQKWTSLASRLKEL